MEWGGGVHLPSRLGGLREHLKLPQRGPGPENEFWHILELEKTHLIDKIYHFFTYPGDLASRIEMPGGLDCAPWAVCWTLLN